MNAVSSGFKPFVHHHPDAEHAQLPGGAVMRFANQVRDIAGGVARLQQLIEWEGANDDARQEDPPSTMPPILSINDRWQLARLSIVALEMLEERAGDIQTWAEEHHTTKTKAARKAGEA